MKPTKLFLLPAMLAVASSHAAADTATFQEAVQQAVLQSPEVTARWHAYKAADEEVGVARGGFLPQLDLSAGRGREHLKDDPDPSRNYTRTGYRLTLNQMLFDGFATSSEVSRLGKAKLVRYYELLEASENTALEAARAYLDVLRYRDLVALAEDNYVQHKATNEQMAQRVNAGVGKRVDMEQAGSRLALAEVNLTTEIANLHDVSARYQRLVGAQPPSVVVKPDDFGAMLPATSNAALSDLYRSNPTLLAAVENVEAAQYDIDVRRAAYYPRFDLRASTDNNRHYLGGYDWREQNVVEIVMNWNLFRGGSDRARERQYMEHRNTALDLREKACRDTRQTLLIAFNDVQRLRLQKDYLATQVALLERTLIAYRDQFNIGQRSLLDVLDTENELLSARRNVVNAENDLTLGMLRTYAGMGHLLQALGLRRLDTEEPKAGDLASIDPTALCPADAVSLSPTDRAVLDARAAERLNNIRNSLPAPVSAPPRP
ncbi:MAG: TolC family outer membrane protein [Betaproteobacteria bacterium]|nr:TolC family outer membrane protein [Betaproteobacteria bacterium]